MNVPFPFVRICDSFFFLPSLSESLFSACSQLQEDVSGSVRNEGSRAHVQSEVVSGQHSCGAGGEAMQPSNPSPQSFQTLTISVSDLQNQSSSPRHRSPLAPRARPVWPGIYSVEGPEVTTCPLGLDTALFIIKQIFSEIRGKYKP